MISKAQNIWRVSKNVRCSNLRNQLKIDTCLLSYMNFLVTTNQKHITDTHKKRESLGHWKTQVENLKIPWDKWKHNISKSMGHSKSSSKRKGYSKQAHLRKQENSQTI